MSDTQEAGEPQPLPESSRLALPPRLTPSPDATESEFKLSRKREREVSLEPATTPTAHNDTDPLLRERKDSSSRTPLKKNRRRLDVTEEEEDSGGSGSRSASGSPPTMSVMESPRQEMKKKVRQISRGVEDITWKSMESIPGDKEHGIIHDTKPSDTISEEVDIPGADDEKESPNHMDHEEDSPPKTPEESSLSQSVQDIRNGSEAMILTTPDASRLLSGTDTNEKGLKRKYLERGTSHGPPEQDESVQRPSEALKRLRDEPDKDDNPRDTKRPSPPPASPPRKSPPSPKIPKLGGFMAYASTSSPFSSVKGQNIFGSSKSVSPFSPFSGVPASGASPLAPAAELDLPLGQSSTPSPPVASTVPKKTGFEAFASSSSPFATAARTNTPVLGSTSVLGQGNSLLTKSTTSLTSNPFASYAGPSSGFGLPAPKRARGASPDGSTRSSLERASTANALQESRNGSESPEEQEEEPTTFGERLRAGRDEEEENKSDEENQKMEPVELATGEEDEETIHQVRGKLFSLDENAWKERGTGLLRLNVKIDDGTGARLLMRKDAVHTLLLNVILFPGMRCSLAQDPRYIRFSAIENGVTKTYNLKVSNAKIAADLLEEINANIPT
ncbi:hypothetical protein BDN70DRAFT_884420 [Pholiota conissans]|uniref:RanBD1 domain-containing protein n=1 Tax=Pholiota conissans TaxID=109636 RepID=A0A9P6CWP8_9AGAR|nr:hypothetical protein BDN70DRAFT_884420 [Pholiota conissans]